MNMPVCLHKHLSLLLTPSPLSGGLQKHVHAPLLRRQPLSSSRPDALAAGALAARSSFQGTAWSADSPAARAARSRRRCVR